MMIKSVKFILKCLGELGLLGALVHVENDSFTVKPLSICTCGTTIIKEITVCDIGSEL